MCTVLGGYNASSMNDEPIDGGWLDEAEVVDDVGGGGSTPGDDYGD